MTIKTTVTDIYADVTKSVIAALAKGERPWLPRLNRANAPMLPPYNPRTGTFYGGMNVGILWFQSFENGFDLPYWLTVNQAREIREVCGLMQQAISDRRIPKNPTVEEITRTGWPERVAPVARRVSDLMLQRGRFSENEEEEVPSGLTDLWKS